MEIRNNEKILKQVETLTNRTNIVKERSEKMSFISLDLKWSHECPFCFCLHLNCTVREERKQCCSNGKMVRDANKEKFRLKPFSMEYLQVLLDNGNHLKTNDIYYNNNFRMSYTGTLYNILYVLRSNFIFIFFKLFFL
jgi:hypothetical protein